MNQTEIDRDALTRALAMCRAENPGRAAQIDSMLTDRPWKEVASFAANCSQTRSLDLMPWQSPPCIASLDHLEEPLGDARGLRESAELLRRLLDAGLSKYEPDPLAALEQARQHGMSDRSDHTRAIR